jgi:hypothetical protein
MREPIDLEGVSSGMGDSDAARLTGVRRVGSFELDEVGVSDDADRCVVGVFLAYWLGVVKLRGLKLWPVSTEFVLIEGFQRGRVPSVDIGR